MPLFMRILIFFIFFPQLLLSQNTIGLPDVINYSKQVYKGGLQNWDIKQDKNGIVYLANNEGLLTFDGNYWNLYPLPNKTIVRSLEISNENNIYVGGQDEFGYFSPNKNGKLIYTSLITLLPANDRLFGDVWNIVTYNKSTFFQTNKKIYKLTNNSIYSYEAPTDWSIIKAVNAKLFAHDLKSGLLEFKDNFWKPVGEGNEFVENDPITAILPLHNDSILITTLKSGLYILGENNISKLKLANNNLFSKDRIYKACLLRNDRIALATNNNGVYIIDIKGGIIQSFSKNEGLQNYNVLSIYPDQKGNLWLGLDNGIDFINYNSAIKNISPDFQNSSGYTAVIFNNYLFTGTSNGLFSVPLQDDTDLSFTKGEFSLVKNTNGQNWSLSVINNELLLGHHEGVFNIKNNVASPIIKETGFWTISPVSNIFPTSQLIAGNYKGVSFLNYNNGTFSSGEQIPDFKESSRFLTIDKEGNFWVSHPFHGVFKITRLSNNTYKINSYTDKNGLPSTLNNHIYNIKNEVLVTTERGIYTFNSTSNKFEASNYYKNIFEDISLRYLKEDKSGNIWFIHEKNLGVVDFSKKEPTIIHIPEMNEKVLSGFEFIYPYNSENIFIGSEKGFFNINYNKYKDLKSELKIQIRSVHITSKKDSLLFAGYFSNINENQIQLPEQVPSISYRWKTIRFEFSSPLFGQQPNLEYSYQLDGFESSWSDWTKKTEKEYTNLKPGSYTFKVKVRNNLGNESAIASYSMNIQPPWYQTILARILYLILAICTILFIYRIQKKKFKQQEAKYEEEQKKLRYIHELEKDKAKSELMNLKNEKLESEINFKNTELASSAMHLVKKGELLTKIKSDLSHVIKTVENKEAKDEVKKIIRSLNDDESLDLEWNNFSKHFDKVHSNFLTSLKEIYPDITPNELKLCAYLRMNLSTKEIAQLMNISVRGVEIGRYRLRKKLKITSDVNLFDHLININNN